jgi:DNA-binding HxlR family transcriptional regulator
MRDKRSRPPWVNDPCIAERAIVLQVLRYDRDARWSLAELEVEAFDVVPAVLSAALADLERHGVVVRCDDGYVASRCAWHLDALGMVSI